MLLSQVLPFTDFSGGGFSLGPLCEGAPPAGGGGENLAANRNISVCGKVLSLRPCGATSLAEGGKEYHKNAQYHSKTGPPNSIAITMPAHRNGPKAK